MNSARDRIVLLSLLLVIVTAATFWRVRTNDFITYDDDQNTYDNQTFKRLDLTPPFFYWKGPYLDLYIPVTYTVWSAIAQVARITPDPQNPHAVSPSRLTVDFDPGPFHSANIALHIFNSLIVFWIMRRLLRREEESAWRQDIAALCGALLFALHPLQVEPVAWVTGMKDVLSTFFALLSLCLYGVFLDAYTAPVTALEKAVSRSPVLSEVSNSTDETEEELATKRSPWLWYVFATLCFLLALLSKPSTVIVPLLAGVLAALAGCSWRTSLRTLGVWILLILPVIWIARGAQSPQDLFSPLWARPLIALDAICFYLSKIVWPVALRPEYSRTPRVVIETGMIYWTWIIPMVLGVFVWCVSRKMPLLAAGASIFVLTLLPVLGLVPFSFQYYSTVADRYSYLAMLGPALILAALLAKLRWRPIYVAAGLWLLLLAVLSFRQITVWRDSETLYRYTIAVNPRSWQARLNLGALLADRGQVTQAEELYRVALRLQPKYPEAYNNIGILLKRRGKINEAIGYFVRAAEVSPTFPNSYYNLGSCYMEIKQYKYAISAFRRNAELRPDNLPTHYLLAELYLRTQQWQRAEIALQNAQKLSATPESFLVTTAVLMVKLNLPQMAIPYYVQALRYRPYDATLHNDLGSTLARIKKYSQAEKAIRNSLKIDPNYATAHNNLGLLLMRTGKKQEAAEQFRRAIELNPHFREAKKNLQKSSQR